MQVLEEIHKRMERRVRVQLNRCVQLRFGHFDHSIGYAKAATKKALVGRVPNDGARGPFPTPACP